MEQAPTPIARGSWGEGVRWELFASTEMPPVELITAVFCVAITDDNKIMLAKSEHGWGLLGGHIEPNEAPLEALARESQEEGGFTPLYPQMFAYRKVTSSQPVQHPDPHRHYPYPISYLIYYWARTDHPIVTPTGVEVIESASFAPDELASLNTPDQAVAELGLHACLVSPA